ncbi:MAG: hypothetical protein KAR14_13005 [Candidatus Aminicenantes bacterium]|nr:hypothetical protein [Candidatus Aminicenantes bacterium]
MTIYSNNRGNFMISILIVAFLIFSVSGVSLSGESKAEPTVHKGKLLQMFKSGGYTYLEYESKGKKHWAASKMVVANVGNIIEFKNPILMKDFYSKTLKRNFDWIYFAGLVRAVGKTGGEPMSSMQSMIGHQKMDGQTKVIEVIPGSVKKADGGITIEECFSKKDELENKIILIRAKVVKFSPKIKGTNWVHIRDGSGKAGTNDITFTTKEMLAPGDMIVIKGKLMLNKDIGSGYKFAVFMEDPEITKE